MLEALGVLLVLVSGGFVQFFVGSLVGNSGVWLLRFLRWLVSSPRVQEVCFEFLECSFFDGGAELFHEAEHEVDVVEGFEALARAAVYFVEVVKVGSRVCFAHPAGTGGVEW